jgi:hypothetical protein
VGVEKDTHGYRYSRKSSGVASKSSAM